MYLYRMAHTDCTSRTFIAIPTRTPYKNTRTGTVQVYVLVQYCKPYYAVWPLVSTQY